MLQVLPEEVLMLDLMRRYAFGFVNNHDPAAAATVMADDYRLHMGSDTLVGRDDAYLPAVVHQIQQFPGLGFTIHELITDGTTTALLFSEHGRAAASGAAAVWRGVSIYRAEAGRLAECWVEQDHFGRRRQVESGRPDPLGPPAGDPWTQHVDGPMGARLAAQRALAAWSAALTSWPPPGVAVDAGVHQAVQPVLAVTGTVLNALVVEGDRVAFNLTVLGRYLEGLPGATGRDVEVRLPVGAFGRLLDGELVDLDVISNRVLVQRQLRATTGQAPLPEPTAKDR